MPSIDPHLGLDLKPERTLVRHRDATVSVVIPAHNEAETIAEVVGDARHGLELLGVHGDITVSASGCTDDTAARARAAGAAVIDAPVGKGNAIVAGVQGTTGDVVVLIDGDLQYYGDKPLAALLAEPILAGIADAVVTDLYWRPLYPQLWLAWFAPVAGAFMPELLPKIGSTAWSGQRAARRELWPAALPDGFTSDLALVLAWNETATRLRPVLADDWRNPQRPKPDLMDQELDLLLDHAAATHRITPAEVAAVRRWWPRAHANMSRYRPEVDDPQDFEREILHINSTSLRDELRAAQSRDV